MGPLAIVDRIRALLAGAAWRVFLWANRMTEDEYWSQIYEQEKYRRDSEDWMEPFE